MRPVINGTELNDLYAGIIVCLVGLLSLGALAIWYYLNGFRRRLQPALLLIQRGHFVEAEKSLSKLGDAFPRNVAIPALRIICFENIEAYQTAMNTVENISELLNDPGTAESAYFAALFRQFPHLKNLNYHDAAKRWLLERSLEINARKAYQEENYQQALQRIEVLIAEKVEPTARYLAWKAHLLLLMKDFTQANTVLASAENSAIGDIQASSIRGHWHLIQGDIKSAIAKYVEHGNRKSIEEDLRHIEKVFGITPPTW